MRVGRRDEVKVPDGGVEIKEKLNEKKNEGKKEIGKMMCLGRSVKKRI